MVVVHYGTDDLTMRSLRALVEDDVSPPTTIVVVDNGPGEPLGPRVRRELPTVEVVSPGQNLGFAGGCNAGIRRLGPVDHVALVNSDAVVRPGWLVPLLAAMDADRGVGAACPKILFEGLFHTLHVEAEQSWTPGRGDGRALAWRLDRAMVGGVDVTERCLLVDGFWEPSAAGVWAGPRAVLRLPALDGKASTATLTTTRPTGSSAPLLFRTSPTTPPVAIRDHAGTVEVLLRDDAAPVVNNAGNAWCPDGYGLDLGYQEVDCGQYDVAVEVPAWCGGAVLLRGAYLEAVGGFDERLFLYYEDLELARRGAALGWRYQRRPDAVVEHRHGASAAGSTRTERLKERNRLLVVLRHDGAVPYVRALVRFAAVTASYGRRDLVAPMARGQRPDARTVRMRLVALAGALARSPGMLVSRRRDRGRRGMPSLR